MLRRPSLENKVMLFLKRFKLVVFIDCNNIYIWVMRSEGRMPPHPLSHPIGS